MGYELQIVPSKMKATRAKLRKYYEGLGFELHSLKQIGHFSAARYEMDLFFCRKRFFLS